MTDKAAQAEPWDVPGSVIKHGSWEGYLTFLSEYRNMQRVDTRRIRAAADAMRELRCALEAAREALREYADERSWWRATHTEREPDQCAGLTRNVWAWNDARPP